MSGWPGAAKCLVKFGQHVALLHHLGPAGRQPDNGWRRHRWCRKHQHRSEHPRLQQERPLQRLAVCLQPGWRSRGPSQRSVRPGASARDADADAGIAERHQWSEWNQRPERRESTVRTKWPRNESRSWPEQHGAIQKVVSAAFSPVATKQNVPRYKSRSRGGRVLPTTIRRNNPRN